MSRVRAACGKTCGCSDACAAAEERGELTRDGLDVEPSYAMWREALGEDAAERFWDALGGAP